MADRKDVKALISGFFSRLSKALTKRRVRLLGLSVIHATWLIFLTLLRDSLVSVLPLISDEEKRMLQITSFFKHAFVLQSEKPDPNRFLFVCISWDKALMEKKDPDGFPIGTQTITDRQVIARFLSILNQKPDNHKFLLLDMRFDEETPDDSVLVAEFKRTHNYLVSYHKDNNDRPVPPVLPAKAGLADYETTSTEDRTIIKFSAIQADSLKTSPLLMYEKLHGKQYKAGWLVDYIDRKPVLNTFILDYRILLNADSLAANSVYHHTYLGELLTLPPEEIHKLTKDRIIVAGDFEDQDIHETIYGNMPGSVILLNAFLALENGDNAVSVGFILFLLAGYTLLSYRCFSQHNFFEKILVSWLPVHEEIKKLLADFAGYVVILILMSVISYFLFNIHLTILLLAIYLQIVDGIISFYRKRKGEREWKKALDA